jgi:predicted O-linked N-acetylglucosamine transferase (SPINDLY family)
MEEATNHTFLHRADVGLDGAFVLRSIPPGDYVLRVTSLSGQTVSQQLVSVQEHMTDLDVQMPPSPPRTSAPGTVSLRQLRNPPDKRAVRAFYTSVRLSSEGKFQDAAAELEKAVRISPEFADAYTNLAVQHVRMRRYAEAIAETERAMEIAGPNAMNLCNRGFAQFQLGRYAEAADSARAALRLDSRALQAHLILGAVLALDPATRQQAIRHLEIAAETLPSARIALEHLRPSR